MYDLQPFQSEGILCLCAPHISFSFFLFFVDGRFHLKLQHISSGGAGGGGLITSVTYYTACRRRFDSV